MIPKQKARPVGRRGDPDARHRHQPARGLIYPDEFADTAIQHILLLADTLMHAQQALDDAALRVSLGEQASNLLAELLAERGL